MARSRIMICTWSRRATSGGSRRPTTAKLRARGDQGQGFERRAASTRAIRSICAMKGTTMNEPTRPRDDLDAAYSDLKGSPESRRTEGAEGVDKVLNFLSMRKDRGFDSGLPGGESDKRDWSGALDLVHEAFEAMRMSEERVAEVEAQMQDLAQRFNEESKTSQARFMSAERRAEEASARVAGRDPRQRSRSSRQESRGQR